MDWGAEASSASSSDVRGVLSHFNISSSSLQDYNTTKVRNNLVAHKPVYVRANANRHRPLIPLYWIYTDGHAWIINGMDERRTKYIYTYEWQYIDDDPFMPVKSSVNNIYPGKIETEEFIATTQSFLMFNWGWNGSYDTGRYLWTGEWIGGDNSFRYKREIIPDLGI